MSLPPNTAGSGPAPDPLCLRAQQVLVEAALREAGPEIQAHVDACPECGFLKDLSRELGAPATTTDTGELSSFIAVLDVAVQAGATALSRYRLLARLGSGGQGVVYQAVDTETKEIVALKLVRCPWDAPDASTAEVALARRVRHAGVCRIYHTERHGGVRLISMEFLGGGDLRRLKHSLSPRQRLAVMRDVCAAVQAAHEAGILHLDLKPQNILFRSPEEPIVTDFGLAASVSDVALGETRARGGTPGYMAPEQRRGEHVDRRTDVYALGMLLRELFPSPPRRVRHVIQRATSEDPRRRYHDVRSLLRALDRPRYLRARLGYVAALLLASPLLALIPPPRGPRAQWYPEFGEDLVPPEAWNVAANSGSAELPSVVTDHDAVGCARNTRELNDGIAHYEQWEHGFAFPGPRPMCVSLDRLGFCGAQREDAPLCVIQPDRGSRELPLTVKERDRAALGPGEVLGQLDRGSDCRSDYGVTITLDRPREVFALRAWYHAMVPTTFRVDVEDDARGWRTVFETTENTRAYPGRYRLPDVPLFLSFPITTELEPASSRRIRLRVRCDPRNPVAPERTGEPVWLYEVEVFARLSRLEAWRRHIFRTG